MRKLSVVICISTLMIFSCAVGSWAGEKYQWKIGHVRPAGSAIDIDTKWFTKKISSETNGKITFEIFPGSRLGDYTIVQERCAFGEVEMFIGPFGTAVDKKVALAFTPFLVRNWGEARKVYSHDSIMLQRMGELLEKQNIKILGGWPVYFGGIVLTQTPLHPADPDVFKNMIIRVPPMRSFELTAKTLGYTPYPITWFYAREGLKTGMVEGIIGGGAEGYAGLKDLARYYLPVNDHFEYWFVYMNLELWQSLSENEKTIIQNAAREMEMRRYAVAEAEERKSIEQLRDQGTHIVAFSKEERAKMRKKIRQSVWPLLKKEIGTAFDEVVSIVDGQ